jgi:hypothetical protein
MAVSAFFALATELPKDGLAREKEWSIRQFVSNWTSLLRLFKNYITEPGEPMAYKLPLVLLEAAPTAGMLFGFTLALSFASKTRRKRLLCQSTVTPSPITENG